jgi:tRNA (guanine-N7-)-methyltransferase
MTEDMSTKKDDRPRRRVHGRRRGKALRPRLKGLVERLLPGLLLKEEELCEGVDPATFFARPVAAVWLEIGFGKGEHLLWQAERHPDIGFIGCEPFIDGVATLLSGIEEKGLTNIRLLRDDARFLLDHLAPRSLGRAFLLFPDPWPKLRHHKRRFVQTETLTLLASRMAEGAELRIGTDHADYGIWILRHMAASPDFSWGITRPADCLARPEDWPQTRYEAKAVREGRSSIYLSYKVISRRTESSGGSEITAIKG